MANYLNKYGRKVAAATTPQSAPLPESTQERNDAGGFAWRVDHWKQFERFLVLGAEGGTFYASERKVMDRSAKALMKCLAEDPERTIGLIVSVSDTGRAVKNDPAIFSLAKAAASKDKATRKLALEALGKVARTGTHLHHFCQYLDAERGWGRGVRKEVSDWFASRKPDSVAYQVLKYPSRDGWSMRDVLRSAHPKAPTMAHEAIFRYVVGGMESLGERTVERRNPDGTKKTVVYPSVVSALPEIISVVEELKQRAGTQTSLGSDDIAAIVSAIREHRLDREMLPTQALASPLVWEALLDHMKPMAALRNLGVMTARGVLVPLGESTKRVISIFENTELLKAQRLHPLSILVGLKTYNQGHGERARMRSNALSWSPVQQIVGALDSAFYASFDFVEPTGKAHYLGVDVSGSMGGATIAGLPLTAREAAAALAMVAARVEKNSAIFGFCHTLVDLKINATDSLAVVIRKTSSLPFGSTDCAAPILHAEKAKIPAEIFHVYTDNETWAGRVHPSEALKAYRAKTGIPAKLVTIGMSSGSFTIADPSDPGMLDIVGCSTDVPAVLADFARE
jgi:60 kDa SS-A/Ro ribonucleoprotein